MVPRRTDHSRQRHADVFRDGGVGRAAPALARFHWHRLGLGPGLCRRSPRLSRDSARSAWARPVHQSNADYWFRQSALDIFALLDALGIDSFKAIGVSGGGQTLLHMATLQPSRVQAMVLVSTAHYYFPDQARAIMRSMTLESHTDQEWAVMRRRHPLGDDQIRALWTQSHNLKDSFTDVNFTPPYYPRLPRAR